MRMTFWKRPDRACPTAEEVLAPLPERFRLPLLSMYAGELQRGTNGRMFAIDPSTRVSPEQGMWIYELCRQLKPGKTIEIGLAYGYSTIYILAALHANGSGSHVAIDPFQGGFHDIGLCQPEKVHMEQSFRHVPEKSVSALGDLARRGELFQFTFVDGNHRFDDALLDFTLSAEVCPVDGHIVLDDLWMPAIQRVVSFIRNNRKDFVEVPTPIANVAAFKRTEKDTRNWDYHVDF
ncbi:MAG: class I SAM-dependent methyltransferase [Terracidiphilus sp.]